MMTFGCALNSLRKELGWTQKELADALHTDSDRIVCWESGKMLPSSAEAATVLTLARERCATKDCAAAIESAVRGVERGASPSPDADEQSREERLAWLLKSAPVGLATCVCGAETIEITYHNDCFCAMFGMTAREYDDSAAGDPLAFVSEEDKDALARQYRALAESGVPMDCVYRVRTKGGETRWIEQRAVVAERKGDISFVNAALFDITQLRQEREQLHRAEEEYRLAVKHSQTTTCRLDIDKRVQTISPDAAKRLNIPQIMRDVPYGSIREGRISSDTQKTYIDFYEGIIRGEKECNAIFQTLLPSGWRWIDACATTLFSADGKPVSAVISYIDVTEQQEKEAVFKKWQQRLLDKGEDAYTLYRCNLNKDRSCDTAEGTLVPFVPNADDTMSFNDITAAFAMQCVYPDDREKYIEFVDSDRMLASYHRGKRAAEIIFRCKISSGDIHWLRLSLEMIEYPHSTDVEAYLMYEDVNDVILDDLRSKKEAQTDPLTGLLNRSAFIEKFERMLSVRAEGALTALFMLDMDGFKLVNDIFGHAAGDRVLIDVGNAIRSILRENDLVCRIGGDEFLVGLSNMPDRNVVIAKAKQLCRLTHKAFNLDVRMSISLGVAVSPNDGDAFDDLYQKADKALYYVKEHGKDNCAFYSDDMHSSVGEHEQQAIEPPAATGAKRRMLIVEDNPASQALLVNIFTNDFEIDTAGNGAEALAYLRRNAAVVNIILLDLVLPEMDGIAVLEKLRDSAELQAIPVIVVSGLDDRETNLRAIRYGASDYVVKPVDADLLRVRVASAISKAENERLRMQNQALKTQQYETERVRAILEADGTVIAEYDHTNAAFRYEAAMTRYLLGNFDDRALWDILTQDNILSGEDAKTLRGMTEPADDNAPPRVNKAAFRLKTASGDIHSFRVKVIADTDAFNEGKHTLLVFTDLEIFDVK